MNRIVLFLVGCLTASCLYAYTCVGSCHLAKEEVDSVFSAGDMVLNETMVSGDVHVAGALNSSATRMHSLFAAGQTTLDNTVIEGPARIAGKLKTHGSRINGDLSIASKANFTQSLIKNHLKVSGDAELLNTRVGGQTKVAGVLMAKHSIFNGPVKVAGERVVFSAVRLNKGLTVESKNKTPIVELACGTRVKGPIIFEGKSGIVKVEQPNKTKIKVTNGKVVELEKASCTN